MSSSPSAGNKRSHESDLNSELLKFIPSCDFKGVKFRDISPLLANHAAFQRAIDAMVALIKAEPDLGHIDAIVGLDAR